MFNLSVRKNFLLATGITVTILLVIGIYSFLLPSRETLSWSVVKDETEKAVILSFKGHFSRSCSVTLFVEPPLNCKLDGIIEMDDSDTIMRSMRRESSGCFLSISSPAPLPDVLARLRFFVKGKVSKQDFDIRNVQCFDRFGKKLTVNIHISTGEPVKATK